jgi:hypothetical protein
MCLPKAAKKHVKLLYVCTRRELHRDVLHYTERMHLEEDAHKVQTCQQAGSLFFQETDSHENTTILDKLSS